MILGGYLLTTLSLDLKLYKNVIVGGEVLHEGCLAPMVDVTDYDFKPKMEKIIKP